MASRLTDAAWLREQVAAHRTARDIAAEIGVTDRAVRHAIRRYGIERPVRQDLIDIALAEYRAGTTLASIAAQVHRSRSWVSKVAQQAGAERPAGFRQSQPPKYPQLRDAGWMRAQLDAGGSVRSIAKDIGTDRHTVRKALARYGIDRWPEHLAQRFQYASSSKPKPNDVRLVSSTNCSPAATAWAGWPTCSASLRRRCDGCDARSGKRALRASARTAPGKS